MRVITVIASMVFVVSVASTAERANAADTSAALYPNPASLKWMPVPPMLPKGAEIAVLSGDPTKPGPFVLRLKLPANYIIPAHHHPTTENVTVLTGTLYAGMGDKLVKSASKPFGPGGFASLPAEMNHFAWTKAASIIQVDADGPFSVTYVDPADDPAKAQ